MLTHLLVILALATAGRTSPVKAVNVKACPSPFALTDITVSCELKYADRPLRDRAEDAAALELGPRYMIRVEDNLSGSWCTGWLAAPSVADSKAPWTAVIHAGYVPDSSTADQVSEIAVTTLVDDHAGKLKVRKRYYFKWRDGLFRPSPDYAAAQDTLGPRPPTILDRAWRDADVPVVSIDAPAPTPAPEVMIAPATATTWGGLKARYR